MVIDGAWRKSRHAVVRVASGLWNGTDGVYFLDPLRYTRTVSQWYSIIIIPWFQWQNTMIDDVLLIPDLERVSLRKRVPVGNLRECKLLTNCCNHYWQKNNLYTDKITLTLTTLQPRGSTSCPRYGALLSAINYDLMNSFLKRKERTPQIQQGWLAGNTWLSSSY